MSIVPAYANPVGEQVAAGAATFQRVGNSLTIQQGTDRAVINWNQFSIAAGETTKFVMPSASSAALNRVLSGNPSAIYGSLQANGHLFLINPAGILVGPGGTINAGSFIASTRDVSNDSFMKGGDLQFLGNSEASILNQGTIESGSGDVFLIAQHVENEGQLIARDGTVGMVSGTQVILQSVGPQNFKVRLAEVSDESKVQKGKDGVAEVVNEGVIEAANAALEATGNVGSLAINNAGTIRATGVKPNADGSVTLTGGEGDVLNSGVIAALRKNVEGKEVGGEVRIAGRNITTEESSLTTAAGSAGGGNIRMRATDTTLISGRIEATGYADQAKGGRVELLGKNVGLRSGEVNVDGGAKGGTVLVGGDYLGLNPEVPNAQATVITPDARISANATVNGDGGRVIVWSDEYTGFFGKITALGGPEGGNGGFIETSSKNNLQAFGEAQASAPKGISGEWLLDPANVTITSAATSNGSFSGANPNIFSPSGNTGANVLNTQINSALDAGTSVTIQTWTGSSVAGTDNSITVSAPITRSRPPTTPEAPQVALTLRATGDILVTATGSITSASGSGPLTVALQADYDQNNVGQVSLQAAIVTRGGNVEISGASLGSFLGGSINTTTTISGGGTVAGDVLFAPSKSGRTVGVGTVISANFNVSNAVLGGIDLAGTVMPGTLIIGNRGAGNLTAGEVLAGTKNLSLVTGGTISGFGTGPLVTSPFVTTSGLLTLSSVGAIAGLSNEEFNVDAPRLAILTEGPSFNIFNLAKLTQLYVQTDGEVASQTLVDNQAAGDISNINYLIEEEDNSLVSTYRDTSIFGVSVLSGSVDFRYTNTEGDINILGGGVAAVQYDSVNLSTATGVQILPPQTRRGTPATAEIDTDPNSPTYGQITITNPGSGYVAGPVVTITGGTTVYNYAVAGMMNVQPANNGSPDVYRDMVLSAPKGSINRTVPVYTGGGNLTLQARDLGQNTIFPGSLNLSDDNDVSRALPSIAYDALGVLNTFEAVFLTEVEVGGIEFNGASFGNRVSLTPDIGGAAGAISGFGGVLSIEAVNTSAEGQPIRFSLGGDTANAMDFSVLETGLFEAPFIRFGGQETGDILLEDLNLNIFVRQGVTTRTSTGPNNSSFDYIPRYFENPFFNGTRGGLIPGNVNDNTGVPHVLGGTVALVSARGEARNVSGGDVNLFGLSLTGVDGIFFDGQGGTGIYAARSQDTSRNSILRYISGRVGRTFEDVTIGNGGDAFFRLPASTAYVNDGRFANTPNFSDFVTSQNALGLGLLTGDQLGSLQSTAGLSRITVDPTQRGQYSSVPLVGLLGGNGQAGSALALMGILRPSVLNPGNGYTPGTYVIAASEGGGNGAAVLVTVGPGGSITDVQFDRDAFGMERIGTGYTSQPTFDLSVLGAGVGGQLGWLSSRNFLQVASIQVQNPGINYDAAPTVTFFPTSSSIPSVSAQATSVVGLRGGALYDSAPVVTITGGGVQQAAARALLDNTGGVALVAPIILGQGYDRSVQKTDSSGNAYLDGPTVTLSGGGTAGAPSPTTSAVIGNNGRAFVSEDGLITVFDMTAFGSGYDPNAPPQVILQGGLSTGVSGARTATARAVVSGYVKDIVDIVSGGRYADNTAPRVVFQGGGGGGAEGVANMIQDVNGNWVVGSITITKTGSGYISAPTITFIGGNPVVNAAASASLNYGVTSLVVVDPGFGYITNPTVEICSTGSAAGASARVDERFNPGFFGNQLTPIYVQSAGSGYGSEPMVTIQGGGVREAQARAIVQNNPFSNLFGRVVGYEITDAGDGYRSSPNVTIGYGQAFGNFGEYGISTETVDRNVGSGNISISNIGAVRVGSMTLNAPVRTGDAQGVEGGDAITGSILLDIGGDLSANDLSLSAGGGARGVIITGDATLIPSAYSAVTLGNARSGSITLTARAIANGNTSASVLPQISGSVGMPVQIGVAQGGLSNIAGSLSAALLLRDATNTEVGDLQIYAPAPGEIQAALGNVPLDPNHRQGAPRVSNDLALSGLFTPETSEDDNGNIRVDQSLVTVELGSYLGKLTVLRRAESQATATTVNGRVTLITPDQGGQLFATAPTVIITGGGITTAEASVFISRGTLVAPSGAQKDGTSVLKVGDGLDNPGDGYFTVPTVTFFGGGGQGAQAIAVLETVDTGQTDANGNALFAPTGKIKEIQIINPGFGYTSLPTVVVSAPVGVQATAQVAVVDGTLDETTLTLANGGLTNPGVGYTFNNPIVTVAGGLLGTARATATVDLNPKSPTYTQITAINISLNGDTFPSGTAAITIGAPASAAEATANLQSGLVTSFTITNPGGGYTSTPRVILSPTGTNPYDLTGDRLGLIADRIQIFDADTPASLLIESSLAAVAPWTNQRPVAIVGSDTPATFSTDYATFFNLAALQRFLTDDLVVGRRNPSHLGVGAGQMTIGTQLAAENLRTSRGLFLAGTRGLEDLGGATGISFGAVALNFGSTVNLLGSGNSMTYLAGIIQGPCDDLSYGASFTVSSGLRTLNNIQLPLTIGEVYGNPAYFTGQRFNQGITTQNGNVTLSADLIEQARLMGFVDTTGSGKYPVAYAPNDGLGTLSGSATVTFAPLTANRPISIYATTPGSGLALRIGNPSSPGLEQVRAASIKIGSSTSGNIVLNSDFEFNYGNYPNAPRALVLQTAGSVTLGVSQVPPSPMPIPTTSSIRVPVFSASAQTASLGALPGTVAGPNHTVEFLAALLTGSGQALNFTSLVDSLSVADLSALGGVQGIQTSAGDVFLAANQINILPMNTTGLASIRAPANRVTLTPRTARPVQLGGTKSGFSLTQDELGRISAAYLQIGSVSLASSITVAGPITLSQTAITGGVTLVSGGAIQDNGGTSGISYSPGNLTLSANGVISLTGSGNDLGTVVANSNGNNITLTSGTPFVISTTALDPNFSSIVGLRGQGATVTLQPLGATSIFLGDLTGGRWGFTNTQLNAVTANVLQIGNSTAGAILVNGVISLTQGSGVNQIGSTFALVSGSTIGDNGGTTGISYPGGLTLTSNGAISFTGSGNDFGTVTASSSGSNITLTSQPFDIASINAGTAIVTLQPIGAVPVVLGSPGAGVWGFDNAELNDINAGILRIGTTSVTSMLVNSPLILSTAKLTTALSLISGGSLADDGGVSGINFDGGGLRLSSGGNMSFTGTGNQIDLLAAVSTAAGATLEVRSYERTFPDPLVIGTVDGVTGITTNNGNASVSADFLMIGANISTEAGNLLLQPITTTQTIGLFGGTGNFNIDSAEFDRLLGAETVTIGRADGSGNVEVGAKSGITRDLVVQSPNLPTTGTFSINGALSSNGSDMTFNAGAGTFTANALVDLSQAGTLSVGAVTVLARVINLAQAPTSLWANGGVTLGNRMGNTYVGISGETGPMDLEISAASLGRIRTTGYVSFGALGGGTSVFVGDISLALVGFGGLGLFADTNALVQVRANISIPGASAYIDGPLTLTQGNTSLTGSSIYLLNGIRGSSSQTLNINSTGNFTLAGLSSDLNLIGTLNLSGVSGSILFGSAGSASVPAGLVWTYDSFGATAPERGLDQQFAADFTTPKAVALQGPSVPKDIRVVGTSGANLNFSAGTVSGNQSLVLQTTGGGSITTGAVTLSGSTSPLNFEAKVLDGAGALSLSGAVNVSGRVDLRAGTGAVATMGNVLAGTGLRVDADVLSLGGNLTTTQGNVQVTKTTRSQPMIFGSASGAYLTQAQVLQLSAPNGEVILGSSENTGGIQLAGPLNLSGANANLRYALENNGNINFGSATAPAVLSLRNGGQLRIGAGTGNVAGSGGVDIAGVGATVRIDSAVSVTLLTDVGFYGPVTTTGAVTLVNAGSVTIGGQFDAGTGNISVRTLAGNLTLAARMFGGTIQIGAAQNFINQTGLGRPFVNRTGRTLVYSAGQRYDIPYNFAGLEGFGVAFGRGFGSMPGSGNFLVYSQYAQTALDDGVVYYEMFSGNSVSALLALSPELFWSVNGQMIPKTRPGGYIDYMLYPQRVEPATMTLPQPVLSRLEQKLGRPPTVAEIAADEADRRRNRMMRTGGLVERNSFDAEIEPQVETKKQIRADRADAKPTVPTIPQAQAMPMPEIPTARAVLPGEVAPQAGKSKDQNQEVKGPALRRGSNRAVALRVEQVDAGKILAEEREKAEVNLAAPVAGH